MNQNEILDSFKGEMLAKLEKRADRYAPMGWKTLDIKRIVFLIEKEIEELKENHSETFGKYCLAIGKESDSQSFMIENMKDNVVDIANYAMFIHHLLDK